MKIELVLIIESEETGEKSAGAIALKSPENEERARRIFAGIDDPLTAKDTVIALARDISVNGQQAIDAVISDLCNGLFEKANRKPEKAVSDGN